MFLNSKVTPSVFLASSTDFNRVLTVPAKEAAKLVELEDPSFASELRKVRYVPLVSVTVWAKNSDFKSLPIGVGYLVPEKESEDPILGVLFNSSSFPDRVTDPKSISSFTVMLGGTRAPSVVGFSDETILEWIKSAFRKFLSWDGIEMEYQITRWNEAIPVYNSDLERVWSQAKEGFCSKPGNILFGNYSGQVSIRGMIESAKSQWSVP
jgi:oxygen-dependent protoporphyrinogen oxidase